MIKTVKYVFISSQKYKPNNVMVNLGGELCNNTLETVLRENTFKIFSTQNNKNVLLQRHFSIFFRMNANSI